MPVETGVVTNQAIARVYYHARSEPIHSFKEKVLEQLSKVIAFDGACWLSFGGNELPSGQQTAFLFKLPEHFFPDYYPLLLNVITMQYQAKKVLEVNQQEGYLNSFHDPILDSHLKKYDILHHCTLIKSFAGKHHILCLYRKHQSNEFDHYDTAMTNFMVENVVRAYDLNLQVQLKRVWGYKNSYKAICDTQGLLLTAQREFEHCIKSIIPNWKPSFLLNLIDQHSLPVKLEFGQFKLQITNDSDLYLLEVYRFDESFEKLTLAEISVAKLLTHGLSAEQIAREKNVSRRTIDNQIMSIYHKLEISKNTQLIRELINSNYHIND